MGWRVMGEVWAVDNVLQVCATPPPSLASGLAVPAGATPAWGAGPSGQRGLQIGRGGGTGHFRLASQDPCKRRGLMRS